MKRTIGIIACLLIGISTQLIGQDAATISGKVTVNAQSGGTITLKALADAGKLVCSDGKIVSFRMTRVRQQQTPVEYYNIQGGNFTEEMQEAIRSAQPGDKFYFEYIRYKTKKGETLQHEALTFVIE